MDSSSEKPQTAYGNVESEDPETDKEWNQELKKAFNRPKKTGPEKQRYTGGGSGPVTAGQQMNRLNMNITSIVSIRR